MIRSSELNKSFERIARRSHFHLKVTSDYYDMLVMN
jgi:hypothetical protein